MISKPALLRRPGIYLVLLALTGIGCQDTLAPEPDGPDSPPLLPALIVSNPGATGALQSAPGRGAWLAGSAFASLLPGSFPNGDSIAIVTRRTGATTVAQFANGGIDPVPLQASAGDTLDIRIYLTGPVDRLDFISVVPLRRPPIVVRTSPPVGRRDVPLNSIMIVVFSEPIDPATLTGSSVKLLKNGVSVSGTISVLDPASLVVAFTPAAPLAAATEYVFLVEPTITDLTGDHLPGPVTVPFETAVETPITAAFAFSCTGLSCTFTNQSVPGTNGGPSMTYDWDFGDGTPHASTWDAAHSYAAPGGQFTVTLTVSDASGTATTARTVNVAVGAIAASFAVSCSGLSCNFTNQSVPGTYGGPSMTFDWDFGDGTPHAITRDAAHTYAAPGGQFNVTLTVSDASGTAASTVAVNVLSGSAPPIASFTVVCAWLVCWFYNNSSDDGVIVSYDWDFGDGSAHSTTRQSSHVYQSPGGQFTVRLTVTDDDGEVATTTQLLTVSDPAPPDVGGDVQPVVSWWPFCLTLSCNFFDGSYDVGGSIVSYAWDFGDGQTSTLRNPSHTYAVAGSYLVTLTVTDNGGNQASSSQLVTVPHPTIDFTVACVGTQCAFQTAGGVFWEFFWDFGDGQRSTEQNPVHNYDVTETSTFTVILSVWNSEFGGGIVHKDVTVTP